MWKKLMVRGTAALSCWLSVAAYDAGAQTIYEKAVEIDHAVHDFGDILVSDGPVSCTFTVRNVSDREISILNVASSCGCTDVRWTKESIRPGASGAISATYSNDEGAFTFDKALTAYVSDIKRPIVLRLRGTSHESAKPIDALYPIHYGPLGFKSPVIKGPNVEQGQPRSGGFKVANIGGKRVSLAFGEVSDGMELRISSTSIAPGETADVSYTITPSQGKWGRQLYYATPLADGRAYPAKDTAEDVPADKAKGAEALLGDIPGIPDAGDSRITILSWTKEDFSGLSREQKADGARLMAKESSASFGKVTAGSKASVTFELSNNGKSDARIYAMDADTHRAEVSGDTFIRKGGKGMVHATIDTSGLPAGEVLVILTLTTNCPARPLINLYVTGFIR